MKKLKFDENSGHKLSVKDVTATNLLSFINSKWNTTRLTSFLYRFFSQNNSLLRSVSSGKLKFVSSRTKSFSKTFFLYCTDEWNKFNPEI